MKNVLVPVDFSPTSRNAALYAMGWVSQVLGKKVVLYHAFQTALAAFHANPDFEGLNEEDLQPEKEDQIYAMKQELLGETRLPVQVDTRCVYEIFEEDLTSVCQQTGTQLVIMGITGGGVLREKLIGSNALKVARHTANQVIIVPPDARFSGIRRVMLLTDYEQVDTTTPFHVIHELLELTGAELEVVHVEESKEQAKAHTKIIRQENAVMHQHLRNYHPTYFIAYNHSFEQAVHDLVKQHSVDLIIVIPKKIGYMDRLINSSHTDALVFHSHVPVLIAHK